MFKARTGNPNRLLVYGTVLGDDEVNPDLPTMEFRWDFWQNLDTLRDRGKPDARVCQRAGPGHDGPALWSGARDLT